MLHTERNIEFNFYWEDIGLEFVLYIESIIGSYFLSKYDVLGIRVYFKSKGKLDLSIVTILYTNTLLAQVIYWT